MVRAQHESNSMANTKKNGVYDTAAAVPTPFITSLHQIIPGLGAADMAYGVELCARPERPITISRLSITRCCRHHHHNNFVHPSDLCVPGVRPALNT